MLQHDADDLTLALDLVDAPSISLHQLLTSLADAGAIVSVRDTNGVMLWASASVSGGRASALGRHAQPGSTYWYPDGGEMPVYERPVDRARITGLPVSNAVYGVQFPNEATMRWNQVAVLPLSLGPQGWSVVTIGFEITSAIRDIAEAEQPILVRRAA